MLRRVGTAIKNRNQITSNTIGIKCILNSHAVVEEDSIGQNGRGVQAITGSNPDIGGGGTSSGDNKFISNTVYDVENQTSTVTVKMENNYFNVHPPKHPLCDCGPYLISWYVDPCPAQCSEPFLIVALDGGNLPTVFDLAQNYPNPFNPTTTLKYQVPAPGSHVSIIAYNVRGQVVKTLVNDYTAPGFYSLSWDGTNDRGYPLATGVYFVQMVSHDFRKNMKMVLLK